ncbi:MAG TPA: hypothetical protein VM100_07160 [Longimicrobiales bacterium]|nr:hypothetical protein [Longimicrobiales bacterium]
MPRNKDFKRLVRDRMHKTGEAYTTARAQLIRKKPKTKATPKAPPTLPIDYAALAGMSDAKVKEKTGCGWEKWVKSLDHHGAAALTHREIAELIKSKYKTPDWWTQTVAVGYERIKGLRAPGQQRDGSFRASKSRTFNVSVGELYAAWSNAAKRRSWIGESTRVKSSTPNKSMRLDIGNGEVAVVMFTAKAAAKSVVVVEQDKLTTREEVERAKEKWTMRFGKLADMLSAGE